MKYTEENVSNMNYTNKNNRIAWIAYITIRYRHGRH